MENNRFTLDNLISLYQSNKIQFDVDVLDKLTESQKKRLYDYLEEKLRREKLKGTLHKFFVPGSGLSIDDYPKYKEFIELSHRYKIKLITAGNRSGKTTLVLLETLYHCLNEYPEWWTGVRFEEKQGKNFTVWMVSDTWDTSKEILQNILFFEKEGAEFGTGMIPFDRIKSCKRMGKGMIDAFSEVRLKRKGGGTATIIFKSSKAGRKVFQGTTIDLIVMDEEPPEDVFLECVTRLITSGGHMLLAFTPLQGLTKMIQAFEEANKDPGDMKKYIRVAQYDCPHFTQEMLDNYAATIPDWAKDARIRGIPMLGSGAIYQFDVNQVTCDSFPIPDDWYVWYALDVGWKTTACAFFAENPNTGECYVFHELYKHHTQPYDYAREIKLILNNPNLEGVIDPASRGSNQIDGRDIRTILEDEGLKLTSANNKVTEGLLKCYEAFNFNKLKIFKNCKNTLAEFSTYRRDDKGNIVKADDHLMDAMRYGFVTKESVKKIKTYNPANNVVRKVRRGAGGWMS